jgi:hypothetical protein
MQILRDARESHPAASFQIGVFEGHPQASGKPLGKMHLPSNDGNDVMKPLYFESMSAPF